MPKKCYSLILAALLCIFTLSGLSESEESFPECDGFCYRVLENETAEILEYIREDNQLIIPEELDGHVVSSIGDEAFCLYPPNLSEITLPGTVTHIGSLAFASSYLECVEIPASVISMGDNPFGGCEYLETLTVAEGNPVFCVQDGVLFNRQDHSLVCFPNLLAEGEYTVPEGTEIICGSAFSGVEELTAIHLPHSLKKMGEQAFASCWNLDSIVIPDSVTEIGDAAFQMCAALKTAVLPAGLTRIGSGLFSECSSLETAIIPDTVNEIGPSAFAFCSSLKEIRIPDAVTVIPDEAFLFCEQMKAVLLPENITVIGACAFEGCTLLSEVQIPETVTEIGWKAFQSCKALHSLALPDSITMIGEDAFFNCADDLTIHCSADSYAKTYCEENRIACRSK